MRSVIPICAAAALLLGLSVAAPLPALAAGETKAAEQLDLALATKFVRARRFNQNLGPMIMRIALQTDSLTGLAETHGGKTVFRVLRDSTLATVDKYEAAWTENLAKAYAAHLTTDEMTSIMVQGEFSPYYSAIDREQAKVSGMMRDLSYDLLGKAASETVAGVLRHFDPK